jgi:endonuclease/exonuclease/phosphatase family metal-dependent hydrolase
VGDFNEVLGKNPALMATICSDHGLLDIMEIMHPDAADIPSYSQGSNRLDNILVSQDLVSDAEHAGLNHYHALWLE